MPELTLNPVGEEAPLLLTDLRGQVVVLEFWATWCSPCIQSMQHLKELEEQFGDKLVVLAVSDERPARIASFMKNTDFPFHYVEENDRLREYFPHRVIPHTVVLSPEQEVAAITRPGALTEAFISGLLRGNMTTLPLKEDRPWDMNTDIFGLDTLALSAFQIQPARPEAPTHSRSYRKGPFKDRRRSFVNFQVPMLYRDAFDISVYRMDYLEEENPETYCVDILVRDSERDQLEAILQDSLQAYFGWTAAWQARETEVWVLSALPDGITLPTAEAEAYSTSGGDHFTCAGATPAKFADYLESHGIAGMPVVDETGSDALFRFDFSFQPENSKSFFEALAGMGMAVKKEQRVIDILVLEPPR